MLQHYLLKPAFQVRMQPPHPGKAVQKDTMLSKAAKNCQELEINKILMSL